MFCMPIFDRVWIQSLLDDFELPAWFNNLGFVGLIIWGLLVFQVTAIKAFHEYEQCMWRIFSDRAES